MSSVFRLLPDYVRTADDGTLENFFDGTEAALSPLTEFLNGADPTTQPQGISAPVTPDYAPASWLPWLAALLGTDISGLSMANSRWYLTQRGRSDVGSVAGIKAAVGATLSGTRTVVATMTGLWTMDVIIDEDELIDIGVTQAVLKRAKPAGVNATLITGTPATVASLAATYTDIADMVAEGKTVDQFRFG